MIKNAFYFILVLFALKIFKIIFQTFRSQENGLIRKLRSISKFMTLSTKKLVITIHIFSNISRRKGNQTIKFGQFIELSVYSLELVSLPHLMHDFLRNKFLTYILLTDQIQLTDSVCFLKYWVLCVVFSKERQSISLYNQKSQKKI